MSDSPIPYARQSLDGADTDAVLGVLRGEWLTQGPAVPAFERAMAGRCRAAHAVAVNSATSALHIACLALDVGPGDQVWTSANTFVASANCAALCGAAVDFVDIDPDTWNLSVAGLAEKLAAARRRRDLTPRVVIPVHFGGQSCDMEGIAELGRDYGFRVLEDASHAVGGRYRDLPIGCCRFSDITVFSFHAVKIITTGEGGMALTNDDELGERLRQLRSHGIVQDPMGGPLRRGDPWAYEQVELGFNYRMTDIQAALGSSQVRRLDAVISRRNALADRYGAAFAHLTARSQHVPDEALSARHLYPLRVAPTERRRVFDGLSARGIKANVHYQPVYLQPYYRQFGFRPGHCPEAEAYYAGALSLPMYAGLTDEEQSRVIAAVRDLLAP
jgi:UDP-4-amino-4,6-dideoxy-N-acetyl-beta-L-altrosamine transaminase